MSKKVNPRRQPASKADVKRAELRGRDDGIKFAGARIVGGIALE